MPLDVNNRMTPEFRLVAACSWIPETEHLMRQNLVVDSLLSSELSWNDVVSLVIRHSVAGQFCTVMGKRGWVGVPSESKEQLKRFRSQQAVKALGQVAELARITRIFFENSIPLIPLKGVALSQELYADPCIRSSGDLDILVPSENIELAEELLTKAGYRHALGFNDMTNRQKSHIIRTLHHHEYINDEKAVHVELHWRSYHWTEEQVDALWETSRPFSWHGAGLKLLSGECNILFLADHGARHDWVCLKWLSDLAMLMHGLSEDEWLSVYGRAAFFDLQVVICQTTALLEYFYEIRPPESFKKLCPPDLAVRQLSIHAVSQLLASADEMARQKKRFAGPRSAVRLKKLKPKTPISSLIRGVMITHADFIECPLPDWLFWLYLPLRPLFWFKRHYL